MPSVELAGATQENIALDDAAPAAADCAAIATAQPGMDWASVARRVRLIADTRNATAGVKGVTARIVER